MVTKSFTPIPDFNASDYKSTGKLRQRTNTTTGEVISRRTYERNRRYQITGSATTNEAFAKQNASNPGPARGRKGVPPTKHIGGPRPQPSKWKRRSYKTEKGAYNFSKRQPMNVRMMLVGVFIVTPGFDPKQEIGQKYEPIHRVFLDGKEPQFSRTRQKPNQGPGVREYRTISEGTYTRSSVDDVWPNMPRILDDPRILRVEAFEVRWHKV